MRLINERRDAIESSVEASFTREAKLPRQLSSVTL
jgi:hypothetical protein